MHRMHARLWQLDDNGALFEGRNLLSLRLPRSRHLLGCVGARFACKNLVGTAGQSTIITGANWARPAAPCGNDAL
jgi:hypothetical protein